MKRNIIGRCVVLLAVIIYGSFLNKVFAQQTTLELSQPNTPAGAYYARDAVNMKPPFSTASLQSGQQFRAYIDQNIVYDVPYQTNVSSFNRPLDLSKAVGSIPGTFSVSPNGAACYQMPVDVPPGTAGMQPGISISYNSQAGNGLLGVGFNLNGISYISRCGSNMFNDTDIHGVKFGPDDKFLLDGQQLILSGTIAYGLNGAEYHTEMESFSKVISYGLAGSGPQYFKVFTADGKVLEYGNTADSRIERQSSTQDPSVITWLCNKITDVNGNYIVFLYNENQATGEWSPSEIQYTGNAAAGITPYNSIKFFYLGNRDDKNTQFVNGSKIEQNMLLGAIKTYAEGCPVKEYIFSYSTETYSHLNEIVLSAQGEKNNSTVFSWGDNSQPPNIAFDQQDIVSGAANDYSLTEGDFNGDGLTDVVRIDYINSAKYWTLYIANNINNTVTFSPSGSGQFLNDFTHCLASDMNLDGKAELLVYINNSGRFYQFNAGGNFYALQLVDNNSILTSFDQIILNNGSTHIAKDDVMPECLQVGDFDGDGFPDFLSRIISSVGGSTSYTWNISGLKFGINGLEWHQWFGTQLDLVLKGVQKLLAIDLDGDGKSELIKGNEILKWEQSNFVSKGVIDNFNIDAVDLKYVKIADFNGDGISDIAYRTTTILPNSYSKNTQWYTCIFNGKDHFNSIQLIDITKITQQPEDYDNYLDIADFNGDGKSDILLREYETATFPPEVSLKINSVYYSTGYNNWQQQNFNYSFYSGSGVIAKMMANNGMLGFFNIDNHTDFYDGKTIASFKAGDKSQLVTQIKNGFDVVIKSEFSTLLDRGHYSNTVHATYPYIDVNFPLTIATHVQFDNGFGSFNERVYFYENAQSHLLGKGYMGFGKFTEVLKADSLIKITWYGREGASRPFPFIVKTQVLDVSGNILNQSLFTNKIKKYGNRFLIYNVSTQSLDNIKGLSSLTKLDPITAEPDAYGNIAKTITELTRGGTLEWRTTNEYTFSNLLALANGGWALGLPLTEKTTTQNLFCPAPGDVPYVRNTSYVYYTNGQLKNKILEPTNATLAVTNLYEYYPTTGMLKKTSTTAKVSGANVTRYSGCEYDSKYRFVTKVTNQLGHVSTSVYEPKYGNILKSTDANNLTTTYEYDKFGRLVKTTSPIGVSTGTYYIWAGSGGNTPANALTANVQWQSGVASVTVYYDRLGREIRSEGRNFNNNTILADKCYDLRGRLKTESLPYFVGSQPEYIMYSYDAITNRLINKTGPGISQSYSYDISGTGVSVTDNILGTITSQITDAVGNIINSTDDGGTMIFNYLSCGKTGQLSNSAGVISTMKYDIMGRQTELFDADAGTITYAYTGFGELEKQTDARGLIITTKYDILGRLLQRIEPEGSTNYTYDTKTYGKGLPAIVKRLNSSSVEINAQDFTYDSKSRLSSGKTTIKNVLTGATNSYIAGYNYDSYGRLLNYTYPSGFMITHTYNPYTGELAKIEAPSLPNNNLIWRCNTVNALGQITQFNKGAVVTNNTYNPTTHLLTDITTTNNFINLHYSYNNKLQLSARTDTRNGLYLEETFTYDALNRLHTITDDWGNVQTINYQDNGNIQDKTNVGQYVYDGDKIHALSQITQPYYDLTNMPNKLLTQNITYSSFGKALTIAEGNYTYNITYGTEQQRLISEFKETGTSNGKRTYYMGDYEIEENLDGSGRRERHYISGSNGLAAICEKVSGGAPQMHYVHTDIQGSWQAITTAAGVVEQAMSFDAWGRRRDPQTWENYTPSTMPGFMFNRGYTGHEHLDKFGLINMNGRMYDPLMARMLSPDNFVQSPTYSQSYNRYSYCFNNPLAFTDPSGWIANGGNGGIVEGVSHANYNDQLDQVYGRGMYALDGWNGITVRFAPGAAGCGGDWTTFGSGGATTYPMESNGNSYGYYAPAISIGGGRYNSTYVTFPVLPGEIFNHVYIYSERQWSIVGSSKGTFVSLGGTVASNPSDNYNESNTFGDITGGGGGMTSIMGLATIGAENMNGFGIWASRVSGCFSVANAYNVYVLSNKDGRRTWGEWTRIGLNGLAGGANMFKHPIVQAAGTTFSICDAFGLWNGYYRQVDNVQSSLSSDKLFIPGSLITGSLIPGLGNYSYGIMLGGSNRISFEYKKLGQ